MFKVEKIDHISVLVNSVEKILFHVFFLDFIQNLRTEKLNHTFDLRL